MGCQTPPPLILSANIYAPFPSAIRFTQKMEAAKSSKTMVHYITQCYNPDSLVFNLHCCENLKSHIFLKGLRKLAILVFLPLCQSILSYNTHLSTTLQFWAQNEGKLETSNSGNIPVISVYYQSIASHFLCFILEYLSSFRCILPSAWYNIVEKVVMEVEEVER